MPDSTTLIAFLATVALGAYVQTVSGFALGLIVMGGATLLHLAPVAATAAVVSVMALANNLLALRRRQHAVHWPLLRPLLLGLMPGLVVGLALLALLDSSAEVLLRRLLGGFLLLAGLAMALRPRPGAANAPAPLSAAAGALGGVLGGLFSTSGPPVVWLVYRQPQALEVVRATLFAVFAAATAARIGLVAATGGFTPDVLQLSLFSLPVVALATVAGRRWTPPLSDRAMRRAAFTLLGLMGLSLAVG